MYDDGGPSGGTMERPALKRLLEDLSVGQTRAQDVADLPRLANSR